MNFEIKIYSEINNELRNSWQEFEELSSGYCFQSCDWFETLFVAVVTVRGK